jgi:hypothetical protein
MKATAMQQKMIGVSTIVAGTAAVLMFPEAERLSGAVAITADVVAAIIEASLFGMIRSRFVLITGERIRIPASAA